MTIKEENRHRGNGSGQNGERLAVLKNPFSFYHIYEVV